MKKLIGFLVVFGFFVCSSSALAGFSDVRSGSQLETYINTLVEKEIISGYPDGSFKPEQTINRAEALKIIFETIEGQLETSTDSGFPDVPKSEWFAKYVTTAKTRNIVGGYPDGTFKPTQEVNRAEFIKMVMSALPFFSTTPQDKSVAIQQYSDVYDLWYAPYVSAGLQLEFLSKTSELKPTSPMQRQDAVEMVYRISKYLEEHPSSLSESDIPYVPEESFKVTNPTSSYYKPNPELGPDKLMVVRDIGKTEVYHKLHGYNLKLPELMRAWAHEFTEDTTTLESENGCQFFFYLSKHQTIENSYQHIIDPDSFMIPYETTRLVRLEEYPNIEAYRVEIEWKDDDSWETHLVKLPKSILQVINQSYLDKTCGEIYPPMFLQGMSLR